MDESEFHGILADFSKKREARTREVEADRNRLRALNQLYEAGGRLAWFPWDGPARESGPIAWETLFRQYIQLAKAAERFDRLCQGVDQLSESSVCEGFRYAAGIVRIAIRGTKRGTIARLLNDAQSAGLLNDGILGVRAGLECLSEKTKYYPVVTKEPDLEPRPSTSSDPVPTTRQKRPRCGNSIDDPVTRSIQELTIRLYGKDTDSNRNKVYRLFDGGELPTNSKKRGKYMVSKVRLDELVSLRSRASLMENSTPKVSKHTV